MKENAVLKINKMGKVGCILTTIAKVFIIIGIVGTLIGATVCLALPGELVSVEFGGNAKVGLNLFSLGVSNVEEEVLPEIKKSLSADNGSLKMDNSTYVLSDVTMEGETIVMDMSAQTTTGVTLRSIAYACLCGTLYLAIVLTTLFFIGKLCKAFRDCRSPFEDNVILRIQRFAYSLIPWVLVNSLFPSLVAFFLGRNSNIGISIDLGMLVVVLVVFALAYVFKYGAVLQKESDETL
ncbi:MAG: DUF2975 domain-containing protein [Lachnospiraceae bacterium]